MIDLLLFIISSYVLFIFSSGTQRGMFRLFYSITRNPTISALLISLLYFPGILLHELSHFATGVLVFLDVRSISLIPRAIVDKEGVIGLQLGHVTYVKADPVRGFIVGIAPFFYGLLAFYGLFAWKPFPSELFWYNALVIYLVFVISSTMFLSKEDLKDLLYMLTFTIVLVGASLVFHIDILRFFSQFVSSEMVHLFVKQANVYLFLGGLVNILVYTILKCIKII